MSKKLSNKQQLFEQFERFEEAIKSSVEHHFQKLIEEHEDILSDSNVRMKLDAEIHEAVKGVFDRQGGNFTDYVRALIRDELKKMIKDELKRMIKI